MEKIKKYFFDTNAIIYYLKGEEKVKKYFINIEEGEAIGYYSFITKIELYSFPDIQLDEKDKISKILYYLKYIGYTKNIEEEIISHKQKFKVKIPDLIIGYSAKNLKATLITGNKEDFKNIKRLKIINPFPAKMDVRQYPM